MAGIGVCDGARIGTEPGEGARTESGAKGEAGEGPRIAVCEAAIGVREVANA